LKHPEIYKDFMRAHKEVHEALRKNRERRIVELDKTIKELENE